MLKQTFTYDTEIDDEYMEYIENHLVDWREREEEELAEKCAGYKAELNECDELSADEKSDRFRNYLEWIYGGTADAEVSNVVNAAERDGYAVCTFDRARFEDSAEKYWIKPLVEKHFAYQQELESEAVYA